MAAAQPSSADILADLQAFEAERSAFRRLLPGKQGVTLESLAAYRQALFEASDRWVRRWPSREFAWRARLEALLRLDRLEPALAHEAAIQSLQAAQQPSVVVYPEPVELLAARVLVRHQSQPGWARQLAAAGLRDRLAFLDRLECLRADEPSEGFERRRRSWRWKAALVVAHAAAVEGDFEAWRVAVEALALAAPPKPLDDDRAAAISFAAARLELHLQQARLAAAEGRGAAAMDAYRLAVRMRPAFNPKREPPGNVQALAEAREAWLAEGREAQEWDAWIAMQRGYPIPPMRPVQ